VSWLSGGEVVDQWGDIDKKISSYSVRKSLLSALYGIYSSEGVIDKTGSKVTRSAFIDMEW
jgi:hypothetical protein